MQDTETDVPEDPDLEPYYPDGVEAVEAFGQEVAVVRLKRDRRGRVLGFFYGSILYLLMDQQGRVVGAHTMLGVEMGAAVAGPCGDIVCQGRIFEDVDAYLEYSRKEMQ